MHRFWRRVLLPLCDALEPSCIVEVGTSTGALTVKLLGWAASRDAVVHTIDPAPPIDVEVLGRDAGERFAFHNARSLNVLGNIRGVDLALIDGDHNWYTVTHELALLERTALAAGAEPPVVALHDVGWPYGRRDLYYDPDAILPAHRQAYARKGVLPGSGELADEGLNAHLQNAIHENPIHNGVRTAVEDFISGSKLGWRQFDVPGFHGLALIITTGRMASNPALTALLESFDAAEFLRDWTGEIELGRVQAEIAVASERAGATARAEELAAERDRLAGEAAHLTATNEQLDHELAGTVESFRAVRDELGREIERLERESDAAAALEAELRRELILTRAGLEEAEESRRAATGSPEQDGDLPPSSTVARWAELAAALRSCDRSINSAVAERDPARGSTRENYLAVSRSALRAIVQALAAAGLSQPATILDLPCGYGRVTRALRAAWPAAELVAADQSTAAVAFCAEQFAAQRWEVEDYLSLDEEAAERRDRFDLIWSGSLLCSLDPAQIDESLSTLLSMLRPDGVLVAAYHGRDSARRFRERADGELRSVAKSFADRGSGFRPAQEATGLGTAAMAPDWLLSRLAPNRHASVVTLTERGWADHLDVVAVTRRDIHHPQVDASALG
jgi:SAM-dependent methyltransferase